MNLDLGCGRRKQPGFVGVDSNPRCEPDVLHDLKVAPWPFKSASVSQAWCHHMFEHLTGPERIVFMDELWRVLEPDGAVEIVTPYWASWRAVADPTHVFPPVCEHSYLYFNREWRERNGLGHYPIKCNFRAGEPTYELEPGPEVNVEMGHRYYNNVVAEMRIVLLKLPFDVFEGGS